VEGSTTRKVSPTCKETCTAEPSSPTSTVAGRVDCAGAVIGTDTPVAAASMRQSLNRNPALCRIVHLETCNRNVVWMKVIASSIDQEAAVVLSAVPKMVLQPTERRTSPGPAAHHLRVQYLQNNFVHPLDSGREVCMIRNEKSQLNPPFRRMIFPFWE
jgi:hypothetical protein